jgi:hypothetical protein
MKIRPAVAELLHADDQLSDVHDEANNPLRQICERA